MTEPKVTIKNLKSFRGMEGLGFNADIYVNGVKSMFAMDGGNGGQIDYEVVKGQEANVRLVKDYVKSISKKGEDSDMELDMYIAGKVDEYENQKLKAKEEKKMAKLMAQAIVFGVPDANNYRFFNFKRPLSTIPAIILQAHIDKAKKVMKPEEVFLNKNLEQLGVKL
jgi:hypothetical protein